MPFPAVFTAASTTFILLVPALMIAAMVLASRHQELFSRRQAATSSGSPVTASVSSVSTVSSGRAPGRHLRSVA